MSVTLQAINAVQLPEISKSQLKASVQIDVSSLAEAMMCLYTAVRQQTTALQVLEKEASKRQMEVDLWMRNIKNEIEATSLAEGKRRTAENQKLRMEVKKTKEEIATDISKLDRQITFNDTDVKRLLERHINQLRLSQRDSSNKVSSIQETLISMTSKHNEEHASLTTNYNELKTQHRDSVSSLLDFTKLFDLSTEDITNAVDTGTSIELLQQTPIIRHLNTNNTSLLKKIEDTNKNNTRTDESIVKSDLRFADYCEKTDSMIHSLYKEKAEINSQVKENNHNNSRRLTQLEDMSATKSDISVFVSTSEHTSEVNRIDEVLIALNERIVSSQTEREALAREVLNKADWESIHEKVSKEEFTEQSQDASQRLEVMMVKIEELRSELNERDNLMHPSMMTSLLSSQSMKRPVTGIGLRHSSCRSNLQFSNRHEVPEKQESSQEIEHIATMDSVVLNSSVSLNRSQDTVNSLEKQVLTQQGELPVKHNQEKHHNHHHNQQTKTPANLNIPTAVPTVDKTRDVIESLSERIELIENDIGVLGMDKVSRMELREVLTSIQKGVSNEDGNQQVTNINQFFTQHNTTTSANFNGAALTVRCLSCDGRPGGGDGHQFPPSNVFCNTPPGNRVSPPKTRPISPGYSNCYSQTTTRKKLLNYYEWLRGKSEDTPESRDIPANNAVAASERAQSPPPKVPVGTDRRFYPGVGTAASQKNCAPDNPPATEDKTPAAGNTRKVTLVAT